jgi:hypothetical protein
MTTPPTLFKLADVTIAVAQVGPPDSPAFMAYPLTPCCGASGKGSERGIVCRSCYNEVGAMYGDCAPFYEVPGMWDPVRIIAGWTDVTDAEVDALVAQIKAHVAQAEAVAL